MRARAPRLRALLAALLLAGCLQGGERGLPEGPPDEVVADSVRVGNRTHVVVPLEGSGPGEWVVQVRVLTGPPILFWLARPAEAARFGEANFTAEDRLGPNVEGRLRGSFPEGRAVLVLDNTGRGPPAFEPGGGAVVSYRALFWSAQADEAPGL